MNSELLISVNSKLLRIALAMDFPTFLSAWRQSKGWSQAKLAGILGVSPPFVSQLESGASKPPLDRVEEWAAAMDLREPLHREFQDLAIRSALPEAAQARFDRILKGCQRDDERRDEEGRLHEDRVDYHASGGTALVGIAAAGKPTEAARWQQMSHPIPIATPASWQLVEVTGSSAYPVAYPGQLMFIDSDRAVTPSTITESAIEDLADNICLIQTHEDGGPKAYIKRFCADKRAPGGFIFASVDSGRGSPFLPIEIIEMIVPVVGVWFEDPRFPREKGRNRATIVI